MVYIIQPLLLSSAPPHPLPDSFPFPRVFIRYENVRLESKDRRMDSAGILSSGLHRQIVQNYGHSLHHPIHRHVLQRQTHRLAVRPLRLRARVQLGQGQQTLPTAEGFRQNSLQAFAVPTRGHSLLAGGKGKKERTQGVLSLGGCVRESEPDIII